jgi:hypothetical protein
MPRKVEAVADLAEKLVQRLRWLRGQGDASYPLTLERLAAAVDAGAPPKAVLSAVHSRRKAFSQYAVAVRADLQAPVALLDDVPQLLGSGLVLEYLLGLTRTASNQAASVAELAKKLTGKLQKPFRGSIRQRMEEESLPPTVGWLLIKQSQKLFLLTDLHIHRWAIPSARPSASAAAGESAPPGLVEAVPADFQRDFEEAFQQIDRRHGSHNFVSLVSLRRALPAPRGAFDTELRKLRLAGRYSLSAAEGRQGLTPEERDAAVLEDGTLLLYVSKRVP